MAGRQVRTTAKATAPEPAADPADVRTCIRCKQSFTEETNGDTACPATKEQRYHDGALNEYGGGSYESGNGMSYPCGEWSCCGCSDDGYNYTEAKRKRDSGCKTRPARPATRHSEKKESAAAPAVPPS
eukprot:m.121231 g.121231  ORF g.121231 m.121231 type:complete len:128 (+) comp21887_c0_seq2:144-527(+)